MAKVGIDYLLDQIKLSDQAINQMENQKSIYENLMDSVINSVTPEEKARLLEFKAQADRVLRKANNGEAYDGVLDQMREAFDKQKKENGSSSN